MNEIKKITKVFTIFFVFINSNSTKAFNWDKCSDNVAFSGNGVGFFVSTSSFVSSTSECSAIGHKVSQDKLFIVKNFDSLKLDSARGEGEYLSAYASLSGCSEVGASRFKEVLQKNYTKVFGNDLENSSEESYYQIEKILVEDFELKKTCKSQT